jgi:cytochrome b6-f complex iron-sulfur subunit
MDDAEKKQEPQAADARPPVSDEERAKRIAAAKEMAAKVAAARAASGAAASAKPAVSDEERAKRIAAAKEMAAKVAAARAAGGGGGAAAPAAPAAAPARPAGPAPSGSVARAAAAQTVQAGRPGEDPDVVSRRYVLRWLLWGSVAAWFGLAGGTGVAMFWPNKITGFGGVIPAGTVDQYQQANFRPPARITEAHAYIVNPGPGLMALWWKCVHLGCTVPWVPEEDHFHCPCHGSVYLYNGTRIAGPAPRAMDLFPVMIKDGKVFINTNPSLVYQRLTYDPSQCLPLDRQGQWSWEKGQSV